MGYAPLSDPRLREVVVQLYGGGWNAAIQRVGQVVAVDEAVQVVEKLMASEGWRERVAAARIASAFELYHFVEPLVRTFASNPETYTASAFASLLGASDAPNRHALLAELELSCPESPYGRHLVEVIKNAFSATQSAA